MCSNVKPDLEAIGMRVKRVRQEMHPHQTQEEFAQKLGTSDSMVSKIERGRSEPTLTFLLRLNEISGKSIDWILKGEE